MVESKEQRVDLRGEEEAQGRGGERGECEEEPRRRGAGDLIPSRRRCQQGGWAGMRPVPTLVGGTGKGETRESAGPAGPIWVG